MTASHKGMGKRPKTKGDLPTTADAALRRREDVQADFRKIVGPLRGQNQDQKPKP